MKKVAVIGGGASGLIAAIYAKNKTNQVVILERNSTCGKKLLMTGNGKCNYWNEDQNIEHYHSEEDNLLTKIITEENKQEILHFFASLGIIPKIKNGYYYPFSNQASTIKNVLVKEVEKRKIEIKTNFLVTKIKKENNQFFLFSSEGTLVFDQVIVATGSYACPKTGSTGMGYSFAKSFHHTIISPLPSLVKLIAEKKVNDWQKIRTDVILTLEEEGRKIKEEKGEVQLTADGISGICTFNLSYYIKKGLQQGKKEVVKMNFFPFLKEQNISYEEWFQKQSKLVKNRTIEELLDAILHPKLVQVLLKESGIKSNQLWENLQKKEQDKFIETITAFSLNIVDTYSYEDAQACSGGIPLSEIVLETMESKKQKNLYFVGELLDVVGDCGGYNLSFAWISGMLAGKSCKGEEYDSH